MKIFSFIRRQMTPLFALRYLFLERSNSKEPAMSRKIQFACLFLLLAPLSAAAQTASTSAPCPNGGPGPLCFGNNFFVTGDYVVAGAYNMTSQFENRGGTLYAVGTINVPDANPANGKPNPGITGATSVPAGAQIVAAMLYWQTVEKLGVTPGGPGSGRDGFFRPLPKDSAGNIVGPPAPGYPISGWTNSQSTVAFSNGGCTSGSTGKNVRTYRADVRGLLPRDANGNVVVNGIVDDITYGKYEVKVPSSTSTTPITLGATLVIIYRVLSPSVPLNSIVIYDGAYAPGGTLLTMTQTVQGFYDAAESPVSRLTHIVGSGQSKKFETVSLGPSVNSLTPLPSLYPNGLPPFPGFYGSWDNPTWTFPYPGPNPPPNYPKSNPVRDDDASATTMVAPATSNQGCVSWGAVIFSTTVQNTDNDGLLDVWKTNHGYCDASIHEGSCTVGMPSTGWVDLTGAGMPGKGKDVFVQLDYMCSVLNPDGTCNIQNNNDDTMGFYSFDPTLPLNVDPNNVDPADGKTVVQKVTDAFAGGVSVSNTTHDPITLHVIRTHAIQEATCQDSSGSPLCPYPNQPGVVGWPGGVIFFQNQLVDTATGNVDHDCPTLSPPASCVLRFQRGKKDSYHYVLFGHALGLPNWTLQSGTLTNVVQSANSSTVTFTTSTPHHLFASNSDPSGRVTVAFATTNAALNGVHTVTSASGGVLTITQTSMSVPVQVPVQGVATYTFTLVSGTAPVVGDFVTVRNTTNGNGIFNVEDATIAAVSGSTFTVNGFPSTPIVIQAEAGRALNSDPPFTFTIDIGTSVSKTTSYTPMTDRDLSVASGQAGRVSGISDVGGAHSVVTLGNWDKRLISWQSRSGTFMHELGHSLGLTHGGFYFDNLANNPPDYTPAVEANCKPNHQSVMNYRFQIDLLDTGRVDLKGNPVTVLDYSGQALDSLNKLSPGLNPFTTTPAYTKTNWHGTLLEIGNLPASVVTSVVSRYCDGRPITGTQLFRVNGTTDLLSWNTRQDINLDGNASETLRGHNDWTGTAAIPGIDLRQTSATGSLSAAGLLGAIGGANGYVPPAGGGGGLLPPVGGNGGYVPPVGGSGGYVPPVGGSGGYVPPVGGSGGLPESESELTQANANSFTRPPTGLTASEAASPRIITLTWTKPFGAIIKYNIYRSDAGGLFILRPNSTVSGNPPATTTTDNPACNPGGYRYQVKAVIISDTTHSEQESGPSNTVSTGQSGEPLTGCYISTQNAGPTIALPGFISPAAAATFTPSDAVNITWTLLDASNVKNSNVAILTNPGPTANKTLVVIGPLPSPSHDNSCLALGSVPVYLNSANYTFAPFTPLATSGITVNNSNQFTTTWSTGESTAGCYVIELDTDSGQYERVEVQLLIDVTDAGGTPHVTTTSIPNGVVGTFYGNTILEDGGVFTPGHPFTWILAQASLPLPPGITLGVANDGVSGLLSGIPTTAGMFQFIVQVTDSVGNIGTQTLTMTVTTPVAQINQALVPDSSAPSGAGFVLTLNGTGFGPGSQVLWNGTPLVTTFISNKQLTAAIPLSDVAVLGTASVSVSNPVTVSNKAVPNSNIDFFQISPTTSASLSRTDYSIGANPDGLIAADFKGDGKLGLAIANSGDNTVTILLGNGHGTFTAQPPLATGAGNAPQLPTAGDFNGDGKLDLAVANFVDGAPSTVSIFLGKGDGTFQAPATYAVGNGATSLVTGDFNRDGKLDLAVANQNDHTVSILLGNGDGTFQSQVPYPAGTPDVAGVALGDFNRDGKLDLVVANPSANTVSVLLGNGDGTFQAPLTYATGNHPVNLAVADLNGDGILDLAVANLNDRTVSILLGNVNGTLFQAHMDIMTTSGALIGPIAVTTGDFNGDGKVDLVITNQNNNSVSILLGNGNGTFQAPLEFTTGSTAAGVAAGDFNGDGRLDVAVADFGDNTVSIMLQRPEPPTTLAVSGATASQVSLTWTASASTTVVGYNVYRSTTSGGPYTKVNNSGIVAATVFPDMSVASGTTYYYVVRAVDPGNLESINSNEVSATTPPLPPTALAVTNVTASQVTLSWTASTTASVVSYNVYRSSISGSGYAKVGSVNAPTTNFPDTTAASGTTYFYVVTAVGPAKAESVNSNEVSATTPPLPPTGLSATVQGTAPNESVFLSWSASTGTIAGYNVYRSDGSGFVKQNASLITDLFYTDSTVQNGSNTTYYYVVTAVGGSGTESAVSTQASATVP